jgi:Na+(H+)/acetate symporter ActP
LSLFSLFSAEFATTCCEDFVSVLVASTPVSAGDAITGMSTDGTTMGACVFNGLAGLIGLTGLMGLVALVSDFSQLSLVVIHSFHCGEP